MKCFYLTLFLIVLILLTPSSTTKKIQIEKDKPTKTQFIQDQQIKSAKSSAEDFLYDISNLSNNAFEFLSSLGERGINFDTFKQIIQKIKGRETPKEILKKKFEKYDTNGWGVLNFKDFNKFFGEFLLSEAAMDIENRKFTNESLGINEFDDNEFNNTYSDMEYQRKVHLDDDINLTRLANNRTSQNALSLNKNNLEDKKYFINKSFIEMRSKKKGNIKDDKKDDKRQIQPAKAKAKITTKENKEKLDTKKIQETQNTQEKKEHKKPKAKIEETSTIKQKMQNGTKGNMKNVINELKLQKIIPSRNYKNLIKAKKINDLQNGKNWKSPEIKTSNKN